MPALRQGVPHPVRHEVARPELLSSLREHREVPLLAMIAPAGFGKSTLAAAYARTRPGPAAWLTLRPTDRDPRVLFSRLTTELEGACGGRFACAELHHGLQAGADGVELARLLALDLANAPRPCLLVLDDFHVVQNVDEIGQSVDYLVGAQPPGGQVLITARDVPPLSLTRIVAAEAGFFLGPDRLRLSNAEARKLGAALGADPQTVDAAEGWVAGILLGGVAHQSGRAAEEQLLAAYVEREVLAPLSGQERRWLTALAVPDEVTPAIAERLLGAGPWLPRLTRLADRCAFLARDGERHFRLHALVREVLLERLRRDSGAVHARVWGSAACLAEESGDLPGLMRACLELGSLDRAFDALRREVAEDARAGRWPVVLAKLDLAPEEHLEALPDLLLVRAHARLQTGDPDGAREAAEAALAVAGRSGAVEAQASGLVELAAVAHYAGDVDAAETWLDAAEYLVRGSSQSKIASVVTQRIEGRLLNVRGICKAVRGKFAEARELLEQSQHVLHRLGATRERAGACANLGKLLSEAGHYDEAEAALLAATSDWRALGDRTLLAQAQLTLGVLRLRRGDLDGAGPMLSNAVLSARTVGARRLEGYALASCGEWHLANRRLLEAASALEAGLALADEVADAELRAVALRRCAEVALAQRDLQAAGQLLARAHAEAQRLGSAVQLAGVEREQGRLHLAEGQSGAARLLLEAALRRADKQWGPHESVPALYWLGTAQLALGESWDAEESLRQAVKLASAGYGPPLLADTAIEDPRLLRFGRAVGVAPTFLAEVEHQCLKRSTQPLGPLEASGMELPRVEARLLGTFQVTRDGSVLRSSDWRSDRARELFAYLAVHPLGVESATAASALWPELDGERAQANLRLTAHRLRSALGSRERVGHEGRRYALRLDAAFRVDTMEFDAALQRSASAAGHAQAQPLADAVQLYRGPLLREEGWGWLDLPRRAFRGRFASAASRLARLVEHTEPERAAELMARVLAEDPEHEGARDWTRARGRRSSGQVATAAPVREAW